MNTYFGGDEVSIKEYRLKKGYSQNEMAKFLGIEQQSYSRKELGQRGFNVKELFMLEYILDASISEMFKDIKKEAKEEIKN